jgi:hypothetical protein
MLNMIKGYSILIIKARWCHKQKLNIRDVTVYLFGEGESKAKNSKVAHDNTEQREHDEFILVQASGE